MGDLLYAFTEWLRTTWVNDTSLAISDWKLSLWLDTHFWAIPIMQCFHILAISAAFGAIIMVNLRIFRLAGTDRTFAETERRYVRWIWWSLLVLLITGAGMTIAEPPRELINPIFWIKIPTVIFAVFVSLWFHNRVMRRLASGGAPGAFTKGGAVFVLLLWLFIMFLGRWIAYAPT